MSNADQSPVRDVWHKNFQTELDDISRLLDDYPFVAFDTEFSGEVFRPELVSGNIAYDRIKINTDRLRLIQVGITLANHKGEHPSPIYIWQFNLELSTQSDYCAVDSGNLLLDADFNFGKHEAEGIKLLQFGERLTTSNLVLNDNVKWVSFSASYDFAYLVKVLTNDKLPNTEEEFTKLMRIFFPVLYDIKIITQTKRSLNHLAKEYGVERIGTNHQAGSDSAVTLEVFFRILRTKFQNELPPDSYNGLISGIGQTMTDGKCDPAADYAHVVEYVSKNDKSETAPYIDGYHPHTFSNLIQLRKEAYAANAGGQGHMVINPMDTAFSPTHNPFMPSPHHHSISPTPSPHTDVSRAMSANAGTSFVPRQAHSSSSLLSHTQNPPHSMSSGSLISDRSLPSQYGYPNPVMPMGQAPPFPVPYNNSAFDPTQRYPNPNFSTLPFPQGQQQTNNFPHPPNFTMPPYTGNYPSNLGYPMGQYPANGGFSQGVPNHQN
ncbi:putative CCR4-NOT transcription complex subunit 8 [Blattamonas nauphoetae]|uniref:poly(A)-specific ribonuclease n=1 Tax=Blattamonas nauphoetae TaxID=2049346 RepID=A0ABQ9X756_9EUKA|nr:putative CCR4-NOT transcription complex subunit 8 [Blattamonas nauphoetae]